MSAKLGFCDLLDRCAQVLEDDAQCLRDSHTVRGRWPKDEESVRAEHAELLALAKGLRRAVKYHEPNPLGGPAVIFDACADSIRAGDSVESAMRHYGLAFSRSRG